MYFSENGGSYKLKSAICKKGHLQKSTLNTTEKFANKFCQECGSEIIDSCAYCNSYIIGGTAEIKYELDNFITGERQKRVYLYESNYVPNYCHNCGKPYPWLETFLEEYKELLAIQLENEKELQDKIYSMSEGFIKDKCNLSSISASLLKAYFNKIPSLSKEILINALASIGTDAIKSFF